MEKKSGNLIFNRRYRLLSPIEFSKPSGTKIVSLPFEITAYKASPKRNISEGDNPFLTHMTDFVKLGNELELIPPLLSTWFISLADLPYHEGVFFVFIPKARSSLHAPDRPDRVLLSDELYRKLRVNGL